MAEPFKNLFNENVIRDMAGHLARAWPAFDQVAFTEVALRNLEGLELKQRSAQITEALKAFLPDDYERAGAIMLTSLAPEEFPDQDFKPSEAGVSGWAIMPMVDYVGLYGLDHFDLSMTLFKELTKGFSSEFGIRYFLNQEPERTLAVLTSWLDDPSRHVRRLISEGTRPRLPWGMRLQNFVADPAPVLPLLEALKDDPEEYVRRSVANNLNDIAKDHPDLVAEIAGRWLENASKDRQRLVRHACRTLIKQGHQGTLKAMGYAAPQVDLAAITITTPEVTFGEELIFDLGLMSTSDQSQKLIIDYAIHHRKANGSTSPKVFKWKQVTLKDRAPLKATKKHAIKAITTRKYYPGQHKLEIFINGVSFGLKEFELIMP